MSDFENIINEQANQIFEDSKDLINNIHNELIKLGFIKINNKGKEKLTRDGRYLKKLWKDKRYLKRVSQL